MKLIRTNGTVAYDLGMGLWVGEKETVEEAVSKGISLHMVILVGAELKDANLRAAIMPHAILKNSNLTRANIKCAYLRGANLQGANLIGANLMGANLSLADLSGADLRDADLRGANLRGANLENADLEDAKLQDANFELANIKKAVMPEGWQEMVVECDKVETVSKATIFKPISAVFNAETNVLIAEAAFDFANTICKHCTPYATVRLCGVLSRTIKVVALSSNEFIWIDGRVSTVTKNTLRDLCYTLVVLSSVHNLRIEIR